MLERFRQFWTNVFKPVAHGLMKIGVTPDMVTIVGTIGVVSGALVFFPRGELLIGVLVITAFVFSDLIDGYMARTMGVSSTWGSFLDSTLQILGQVIELLEPCTRFILPAPPPQCGLSQTDQGRRVERPLQERGVA